LIVALKCSLYVHILKFSNFRTDSAFGAIFLGAEWLYNDVLVIPETMKSPLKHDPLPFTRTVRDLIRRIPRGRVVSYGKIAALAGNPRSARQVAWILHATPESDGLAWHRVISARGRISLPAEKGGREQALRLRNEGVRIGPGGTVDIRKYGWKGRAMSGLKPPLSERDLEAL
jgi:methylated-DNA-protein-cysteine methyltransferase-like protein